MANEQQCGLTSKLQSVSSPPSRRNTKNLSLQLNQNDSLSNPFMSNSYFNDESPTLYRHPSLTQITQPEPSLRRRTTLSLSIPIETDVFNSLSSSSSKLSASSILSSNSSHSPIQSSPQCKPPSNSSSITIKEDTLKTQTLIQSLKNIDISDDGDNSKLNAYPNGPTCVYDPYLFLYSEPTLNEIEEFDLVINVAKELIPPFTTTAELNKLIDKNDSNIIHLNHKKVQYYYIPWTHTSKIVNELPVLTDLMQDYLNNGKKILIHCQCGVSRSASLIVAFLMKLKHLNLNDSYNLLKSNAPDISPNMSLIFQLMEWGETLGVDNIITTPQYEADLKFQ